MIIVDLNKNIKIGKFEINLLDTLAFLAMVLTGILLRVFLFSYESLDYIEFLDNWTSLLGREGFGALKDGWYNYTGIYMYILFVIGKLPISNLVGIKVVSLIFDFLLSIAVAKTARLLRENINPLIPFSVVWFLPTIVANSAMWGPCDSIYCFFLIVSFIYILKGDSFKTMLFFSIAFALKLQSIFLVPVIILLFLLKKIRFRDLFLVPLVYIITIIPMWLTGRPLLECLLIYATQSTGKTSGISINYPNIYYLLMNDCYVDLYHGPALMFTVAVLLVIMYFVLKRCYEKGINNQIILQTALLSSSLMVFFLPNMHERYAYLIDLLAILYAFSVPKKYHIPVIKVMISFIAYQTYFLYGSYFSYEVLAILGIYLIFDNTITLFKTLNSSDEDSNNK